MVFFTSLIVMMFILSDHCNISIATAGAVSLLLVTSFRLHEGKDDFAISREQNHLRSRGDKKNTIQFFDYNLLWGIFFIAECGVLAPCGIIRGAQ